MARYRTDKVLRLEHFNRPNKTPEKAGKPIENPLKSVFIIWAALLSENTQIGCS